MLKARKYSYSFFFFKQKTAYEMRISDWSSDVCSSDLGVEAGGDVEVREFRRLAEEVAVVGGEALRPVEEGVDAGALQDRHPLHHGLQHRGEVVDVLDRKSTRLNSSH